MKCKDVEIKSDYYFDVLPIHPQPERLESLLSYLSRLAVVNGITYQSDLVELFTPNRRARVVKLLYEFLPSSLDLLSTACSSADLLNTTFYYLLCKFERKDTTVTKFLGGSIAQNLRFCPLCLAQYNFYKLNWLFSTLKGCLEHSCQLLDCCSYCGQQIPLLTNPITFGKCVNCHRELKSCTSDGKLVEEEIYKIKLLTLDLEFLLTSSIREVRSVSFVSFVGEKLRLSRCLRQESIKQVASNLKLPSKEIFFVEDGRTSHGTASFQAYLDYIYYSGFTFVDLFEDWRAM